jgi:DNA modification methylase
VLRGLADNSVDSVVTDPPYELGFMGKKWDSTGIAYDVTVWEECLRVLKPGGHILAFGGSRTFHRMAVAIEDAGFEIRDSIAWMYGSGFPKSLDVSKAIDKSKGKNRQRQLEFTAWMRATGITAGAANKALQDAGAISENGTIAGHYFGSSQPAIATADLFDLLRPLLPPVPENIERLVAERTGIEWTEYKKRVVTGTKMAGIATPGDTDRHTVGGSKAVEVDVTAAHTPEAKQWEGWGTALKPAHEPIVVGRKPFGKGSTVAANVLEHGVGGLNIDASRIGTETRVNSASKSLGNDRTMSGGTANPNYPDVTVQGRWPANVILDEYSAGLLDEQSGVLTSGALKPHVKRAGPNKPHVKDFMNGMEGKLNTAESPANSGGASRFFYCAKASKRDRNEGLDALPDNVVGSFFGNFEVPGNKIGANPDKPNHPGKNTHPTVKPTSLMRYLIKLVTPVGGTVLDPFTGSGSTGKAALLDGYKFVGAELTEEYLPIIEGRLTWAQENTDTGTLF